MDWKEITHRMRGLTIGPVGLEWEPPERESKVAQQVITFLEDRRVLFNPYYLEDGGYCVQSVLEIRHFLTETLQTLPNEPGLSQHLRVLRGACRNFLDKVQGNHRGRGYGALYHGGPESQSFFIALGELRCTFGIHLGLIASTFHLGLEGDLASVLPEPIVETEEKSFEGTGERNG
jgi:hypothetical protein